MSATSEVQVGCQAQAATSAVASPTGSAETLIEYLLEPGEQVAVSAECLRRVAIQLFEKATVVVTDQRLLVISRCFPWGYKLKEAHFLEDCRVANGKGRLDGSCLLVLAHNAGKLCIYLPRSRRQEADAIVEAMGRRTAPTSLPEYPTTSESLPDAMDSIEASMELSALSRGPEVEEEA